MKLKPSERYSEAFKARAGVAMELSRLEKYDQLLAHCELLLRDEPDCQLALVYLAEALWKLKLYEGGIAFCESRVQSCPGNEFLSVIYFQILMETGREREARQEMDRFLAIADSATYEGIMSDFDWKRGGGEGGEPGGRGPEP